MSSGTESQLAVGAESTFAVAAATPTAYEMLSESIQLEIERIESEGLRNDRYIQHQWRAGNRKVGGAYNFELAPQGLGFWLTRMLGALPTTTGAGPYEHVFIPGDFTGLSHTAEIARPQLDGQLQPFQYVGGYVDSWELSLTNNELLSLSIDVMYADEILGTLGSPAVATYPANYLPFSSLDAVLTIDPDGTPAELCISDLTISGNTGLDFDRFRTCTDGNTGRMREPRPNGRREITGSITLDFEDVTEYNRFRNSDEAEVRLVATQGTNVFQLDLNVRYEGQTPNVEGVERLSQTIDFKAVSNISDADALTMTLTNDDAVVV